MEKAGKLEILKVLKKQYEANEEAATLEMRICGSAKDTAGADSSKKRALEFATKLKEVAVIEAELTADTPETPAE